MSTGNTINDIGTLSEIMDAVKKLKDRARILALSAFIAVIANENGEHPEVHETAERCRNDFTQEEARRAIEVAQQVKASDPPAAGEATIKLCDDTIAFIRTHWLPATSEDAQTVPLHAEE